MKLEKKRFCAFIETALCAALVFAGAGVFGQVPENPPDSASLDLSSFGSYFVVLPSPPVLRRGFCIVKHSALGGITPEQERLATKLKRDLVQRRVNAKIKWEAKTPGPADEIFVRTKVKGTLTESQQARVDAIAASLEAGGERRVSGRRSSFPRRAGATTPSSTPCFSICPTSWWGPRRRFRASGTCSPIPR
jgi:hypothetical protein